jgi:hypothetical protein
VIAEFYRKQIEQTTERASVGGVVVGQPTYDGPHFRLSAEHVADESPSDIPDWIAAHLAAALEEAETPHYWFARNRLAIMREGAMLPISHGAPTMGAK